MSSCERAAAVNRYEEMLERELEANLRRSKERTSRRVLSVYLGAVGVTLVVLLTLALAMNDWTDEGASKLATWFVGVVPGLLVLGVTPIFALLAVVRVTRLVPRRLDEDVGMVRPTLGGGYRVATSRQDARPRFQSRASRALVPAACAAVWVFTGDLETGPRDAFGWEDRAVFVLGLVFVAGLIILAKRAHRTWRARRNARLELEWERRAG